MVFVTSLRELPGATKITFRLDRYIDPMNFPRGNFIINLNIIVYLLVILFYTVSSSYCSYPAYLLRQLMMEELHTGSIGWGQRGHI
jgi:hypothetical protein